MRDYRFRGKSIEPLVGDDQWVYGFGVHVIERTDGGKEYWLYTEGGTYQVDPETVGQYIAKDIYDGDIVDQNDCGDHFIHVAKWIEDDASFMFVCNGEYYGLSDMDLDRCKVIGNRWDNPDLLEVTNE